MDIQAFSDVQKQTFQRLLDKLIARNKFSQHEVENFQALLENARDSRNLQKIMEKFKECGQIEMMDHSNSPDQYDEDGQ